MANLYADSEQDGQQAEPESEAQADDGNQQEEGNPIVFDKKACPDCKPGDMLMVKVVQVHDAEIEGMVQKSEEGEHEEQPEGGGEEPGEGAEMPSGPSGMYD